MTEALQAIINRLKDPDPVRLVRNVVYKLGFRPVAGSIFYSPSNSITYAWTDLCHVQGDANEGYCMCIKKKGHLRRGEPHACAHGSWR